MEDIKDKEDIAQLVQSFYSQIQKDDLIGPIFLQKIAQDQWPIHLEKMTSFWSSALFGERGYRGNPFAHHIGLNIDKTHFDRWIKLFKEMVASQFAGPKADEAIMRAEKMRLMFETKLEYIRSNPNNFPIT